MYNSVNVLNTTELYISMWLKKSFLTSNMKIIPALPTLHKYEDIKMRLELCLLPIIKPPIAP